MKNESAVALGKLGGRARAERLSAEQRIAIARKGGLARGKRRKLKPNMTLLELSKLGLL